MPGVGKSTVARVLATHWGCAALDTDDIVVSIIGASPAEFLRNEGEAAFRDREAEVLDEALKSDDVVSTGGGIVTTPRARERLKDQVTLWLDCDDELIVPRLVGIDRPLLGNDPAGSLARLRAQREEWYREVSRARIDASGTIDEVVKRVMNEIARVAK
jgi:shikimate kinase